MARGEDPVLVRQAGCRRRQPAADSGDSRPAAARAGGSQQPAPQAQLPFVLEMERARKSRLELEFKGETAVQVYDGTQGWKLRPFLNRHEVENYTADELKIAEAQADLDGALIDYAAKGTKIEWRAPSPWRASRPTS